MDKSTSTLLKVSLYCNYVVTKRLLMAIDKIVRRFVWVFIALIIISLSLASHYSIGKARTERDSLVLLNYELSSKMDSIKSLGIKIK